MKMRKERNIQPRKRQDVRREDNKNKRKTNNRIYNLGPPHLALNPSGIFGGFLILLVLLC